MRSRPAKHYRATPAVPTPDPWLRRWKDITSFSQGEERIMGGSFEFKLGGHRRLVITKRHIAHPGRWVAHLLPGIFDCVDLGADTLRADEAQQKALDYARGYVTCILESLVPAEEPIKS